MMHDQPSPLAGKSVRIVKGRLAGLGYVVEDWWDRVVGRSWMDCDGNPACLDYAMRFDHDTAMLDTHTHAEVVALFQEAIRNEKRKAGIPIDVPQPQKEEALVNV